MGFASYFEDIFEKLGEFANTLPQAVAGVGANLRGFEIPQPRKTEPEIPPLVTSEAESQALSEFGIPDYIASHWVNCARQLEMGVRSKDQIFAEFIAKALPLITQHLHKGDAITVEFVRKLHTGRWRQPQSD